MSYNINFIDACLTSWFILIGFEDPGSKHQEDGGSHVDVNHSPIPITFLSIPSSLQIVGYHLNLFPMRAINYHKDPSGVRSKPNFDSQNVDFLNDPFWPICIFELRGKCNDDECPWQHLQSQNRQKSRPVISVNLSSGVHFSLYLDIYLQKEKHYPNLNLMQIIRLKLIVAFASFFIKLLFQSQYIMLARI